MWQRIIMFMVCMLCLMTSAWTGDSDEILWTVYTQGSQDKQQVMAECQRRFKHLREKAGRVKDGDISSHDPDVRWLSRHRIPATLIIERELRGMPEGAYLKMLLQLGRRIGSDGIMSRLPDLLKKTDNDASKVEIIRTMADVRSTDYLKTLRRYLVETTPETPEKIVVEAALGLSKARDKSDIQLLNSIQELVKSPVGQTKMLVARHRCGDETVGNEIVRIVQDSKIPNRLRVWVITYLGEEPYNEGVIALGHLATTARDRRIVSAALRALFQVRRELAGPPWAGVDGPGENEKGGESLQVPFSLAEARERSGGNWDENKKKMVTEIVQMWQEGKPGQKARNQRLMERRDEKQPLQ